MSDSVDSDGDLPDEEPSDLDQPRAQDPRDVPVRFSALRMRAKSGAHYRHAALFRGESNLAQRMGQFTHAAAFGTPGIVVFEPGEWTDDKGKTKPHKGKRNGGAWEQFKAKPENVGKLIAIPSELRKAQGMADALRSDPHAAPLLFSPTAVYEHEIEWTIPWIRGTRRKCAGRIDVLDAYAETLTDLKSLRDAEPQRYLYTGRRDAHHAQVVWYADGCAAAGIGNVAPHIVVVENTPPYCVVVHRLSPRAVEDGRAMYRGWLEKLRGDEENGRWSGYSESVYQFDVPDEMPMLTGLDDGDEDTYAA